MARLFGIVTSVDSGTAAAVLINNYSKSSDAATAEARDSSGKVVEERAYSVANTVNMGGLLTAEAPVAAGSTITAGGKHYLVTNASQTETNTAFVDFSLTAHMSDDCDITGINGTTVSNTSGGGGDGGSGSGSGTAGEE